MKNQTSPLRRVYSSELTVITEGKELIQNQLAERYSPKNTEFITSPKQNIVYKQNLDLLHMTSDQLKKSVESNPFMRAKLKCLIKSSQKSVSKDDEIKSPKFCQKNKFEESTNMQSVRKFQLERKQKQQMKLANFYAVMKQNERFLFKEQNVNQN